MGFERSPFVPENSMRVWDKPISREITKTDEPRIYYPALGLTLTGNSHLSSILRSGNTLNPVLVEIPEQPGVFTSPLGLPEPFSTTFFENAQRARRKIITIAWIYLIATLALGLMIEELFRTMTAMFALLLTVIVYFLIDNRLGFSDKGLLTERARFYAWLFVQSRLYIALIAGLFIFSGAFQFGLGDDEFLEKYAMLFDHQNMETWRILTGSLVHAHPAHWLTNFTIAMGIAVVCGPTMKRFFFLVFLVGGTLSFLATLVLINLFGTPQNLGLVGTSGGLSALMGCQITLMIRDKTSYPTKSAHIMVFFLLVSSVIGTYFVSPVSLTCHLTGALAGSTLSFLVPNYLETTQEQATSRVTS